LVSAVGDAFRIAFVIAGALALLGAAALALGARRRMLPAAALASVVAMAAGLPVAYAAIPPRRADAGCTGESVRAAQTARDRRRRGLPPRSRAAGARRGRLPLRLDPRGAGAGARERKGREALPGAPRRRPALDHEPAARAAESLTGPRRRLAAPRSSIRSERPDGSTSPPRPRARARGQRPLLDRLRQRRQLDLLRPRAGGELRARPDADRLRHRRLHLLPDGRHLLGGDGDVSGGGRLLQLRASRLQRVLVLLRRLGPDAQLRHHDLDLGVLRAALPRLAVLGAAAPR